MKFVEKHAAARRRAAAMLTMALLCILLSPVCRSSAEEIQAATMMEAPEKADVHSGPDIQSETIGQLEQSERIFAVELTEGGWYRVVYQGKTGYVRAASLRIYSAAEWDAPENPEATGPSGKIINPEEEYKRITEEAAIKKRSVGITIGVFAGAVLLIAAYGAYVIVKEKKEAGKPETDDNKSENAQGGEAGQDPEDSEMEFLDLEQENGEC